MSFADLLEDTIYCLKKVPGLTVIGLSLFGLAAAALGMFESTFGAVERGPLGIVSFLGLLIGLGLTFNDAGQGNLKQRRARRAARVTSDAFQERLEGLIQQSNEAVVTRSQANRLFDLFKDESRINWALYFDGCEFRADLMGEIASDAGFELRKIWAHPEGFGPHIYVHGQDGEITYVCNKARTEEVTWNFHVAIVAMPEGTDRSLQEMLVFDPALFDTPVSVQHWRDHLETEAQKLDINLSHRFAFSDPNPAILGEKIRVGQVATRYAELAARFDYSNQRVRRGLEVRLRGDYVDELMEGDKEKFDRFMASFDLLPFRTWWRLSETDTRLREQLGADAYFNIPIKKIRKTMKDVPEERRLFTLRAHHWQGAASAIAQLQEHLNDLLSPQNEYSDEVGSLVIGDGPDFMARWFAPDSQALWVRYGIEI